MIGVFEVSTIYLSKVAGIFVAGETVTEGTNTFTLDGMVTGYTVTNSGNGYSVDDNIPVVGGGAGAAGAQFLIDTLTTGSITLYNIVSGGTGYVVGDKLTINNTNKLEIDGRTCSVLVKTVDGSGVIQTVEFEHNGYGYKAIPTISGGGTGTGANITLSGVGIGGIKTLKLINGGFHYQIVPTLNCTTNGDGTATAIATIGGYENEANIRWVGDDGFISAANYIQDSRYYQAFSYEIKSGNTIDGWRDYIKRIVHPAGLALFGRTLITGLLETGLKLTLPPTHKYPYTIIFHDGDIEPPVRLNLQLQQVNPEWPSGGTWPHDGQANGPGLGPGHSDWHIYEIDLPIILLRIAESEDWLFVQFLSETAPGANDILPTNEDWNDPSGTLVSAITASEDWGQVSSGIGGALQLGPMRRQVDRLKFAKQAGYGTLKTDLGGNAYTINFFKDEQISRYVTTQNEKTRIVMNSHISIV